MRTTKPISRRIIWQDSTRHPLVCWAEYKDRILLTVRADPSGVFISTMVDKTDPKHPAVAHHKTSIAAKIMLEERISKIRLSRKESNR